jgi:hypothetical protein
VGSAGLDSHSGLLFIVLSVLTAASAVTAAGLYAGSLGTVQAGGVLFVISAAAGEAG